MKLQRIVLATIVVLFSCFSPSLLASAQYEDPSVDPFVPEGLTDPQLKKAFASVVKLENMQQDGFLNINEKEKKGILEAVQKAEAVLREREQKTDKSQKIYELSLWDKVCSAYGSIEAWKNAVEACEHSFDLNTEKRPPKNSEEAGAWVDIGLARAYINTGNYDKAIKQLNQSVEIAEKFSLISEPYSAQGFYSEIAQAYLNLGQSSEAVKYYRLVLDWLGKINDNVSGDKDLMINQTKANLGFALLKNGNLAEAEQNLIPLMESSKKYNEKIFSDRQDPTDLYEVEVNDGSLYYNLQELRVKQNKYEEALELSERGRTHVLAKTLSKNNTPPKLNTSQMQAIAREQNVTLVEYSIIREPSYLTNGDYRLFVWVVQPNGQIHFRQVDPNSLAEKQGLLNLARLFDGSPQSIVSIVVLITGVGLAAFLLFVKRRKNLAFLSILGGLIGFISLLALQNQIASTNQVQEASTNSTTNSGNNSSDKNSSKQFNVSLRDLVKNTLLTVKSEAQESLSESLAQESCQKREECLKQLHRLLIEPIEELLPNNPEEQVVFIPDAELSKIPFAGLQDWRGKYLIEKHTIRTTPSIRILQLLAQQKSSSATKALVVGNPVTPSKVPINVDVPEASNEYKTFDPLPGAEAEAKAVAQLLSTKAIVGKQATESLVVKEIPQAKIIHFATHGVLETQGDTGELLFTPPSSKTDDDNCLANINDGLLNQQEMDCFLRHQNDGLLKNDGLLTMKEISSLNLNAELVVMSACETGLGHITTDGVIGLVRPFLGGGVPTVIASLWTIPDAPTKELMVEFYTNLKLNPDKAQALRKAMLTIKDKYREPFNWAAFTLVGEN
jgi:CHAT domain-containing protein